MATWSQVDINWQDCACEPEAIVRVLISLRNESNGLICLEFLRFWKEQVQKSNLPDSDLRLLLFWGFRVWTGR